MDDYLVFNSNKRFVYSLNGILQKLFCEMFIGYSGETHKIIGDGKGV